MGKIYYNNNQTPRIFIPTNHKNPPSWLFHAIYGNTSILENLILNRISRFVRVQTVREFRGSRGKRGDLSQEEDSYLHGYCPLLPHCRLLDLMIMKYIGQFRDVWSNMISGEDGHLFKNIPPNPHSSSDNSPWSRKNYRY